ncbi:type VI secretion system membrane subunit TssM, partial [Massilia arenosa]
RQGRLLGETVAAAPPDARPDVAALRQGLADAITTIKTSKLGLARGAAALYELPWYMVIGHPSAGKSSAIASSGLQFPLAGNAAMRGVGGTRNCDWFFSTEGILLDTAGRYSVQEEDRAEWFGFLSLLRRYRRRAPINGIIIAASLSDLMKGPPDTNMELARHLRTRVQELTERLGVHAPVYVVFTKADLIAGFTDFFHDADPVERDRIWGATIRYNRRRTPQDVLSFFDEHFDELHDGLKEMSQANLGLSGARRPGVFTFPLEFASVKPQLRAFLATLFDENTWQFKPVFRGFYFTSALQEGEVHNLSSERVAARFNLTFTDGALTGTEQQGGFFLRDLFRNVIFADKELVTRFANPLHDRLKQGAFALSALALGVLLAGWTWSFTNNRQLIASVRADLDKVAHLQARATGLQARLEGLDILQARIEQLETYRDSTPAMLSFGLFQGDALERKLREEYFAGVREVMLQPTAAAMEAMLADVNAHASDLDPAAKPAAAAPSATNVTDAYNVLKAYLMLGDKEHVETGHLNDQLARYWRGWLEANRGAMPKEQMIRSAERLMTFYLAHVSDPAWPQLQLKLGLLDTTRENLRRVVRGGSARDRVYADIRARASTRFPSVTVARLLGEQDQALVAGSHAVPGAFTRVAWDGYVQGAIRDAASKELQSTDWVLKTATNDDLTLEGSPDQIRKALTDLYKTDYVKEWSAFVQGVTVLEMPSFDASVRAMNRLGDPQASPLATLMKTVYAETAWDGPGGGSAVAAKAERGVMAWFREKILRRTPSVMQSEVPQLAGGDKGRIAQEFAGVAKLLSAEKDASLMNAYLGQLSRLRSRLNQLKNQGDPGPGARQFMQQTLEGSGSELSEALKFVDEQMLVGMSDAQKQALRPLLVRPLMQTFAVIVQPSEAEINKTWLAQVVTPFRSTLAGKYPFDPSSRMEASSVEIGQVFGPEGAVSRFVATALGPLVVRRGDMIEARRWADIGISLSPQVISAFPGWVAPLANNGVAASGGPQTVFQLLPAIVPGVQEYTIEIDGQQLRYKNTTPVWTNMVSPGPGTRSVRISVVTSDGRTVEVFNEAGESALERMITEAEKQKKAANIWSLRWTKGSVSLSVDLKKVSSPDSSGSGDAGRRGFAGLRLPETIVGRPDTRVAAAGGVQ